MSFIIAATLMERKMSFLQNRFDLGEEEKVTGGQIGEIWGVFQSCNVPSQGVEESL